MQGGICCQFGGAGGEDAGYFSRNVRTIEVLVDRDAVASRAAASGEPWQYYDLGHGLCSYAFFEQSSTGWPAPGWCVG